MVPGRDQVYPCTYCPSSEPRLAGGNCQCRWLHLSYGRIRSHPVYGNDILHRLLGYCALRRFRIVRELALPASVFLLSFATQREGVHLCECWLLPSQYIIRIRAFSVASLYRYSPIGQMFDAAPFRRGYATTVEVFVHSGVAWRVTRTCRQYMFSFYLPILFC